MTSVVAAASRDQARKILEKLASDHRGTPWELMARRDLHASCGLEWQAY
jgi:hypothetical protein